MIHTISFIRQIFDQLRISGEVCIVGLSLSLSLSTLNLPYKKVCCFNQPFQWQGLSNSLVKMCLTGAAGRSLYTSVGRKTACLRPQPLAFHLTG